MADVTARGKIDVRGSLDGRPLGGGRRPHRADRRRLGAPAVRTRRRGGPGAQGRVGGRRRRDGDRRDAPVRRVRARGTAAAGGARPADLVGPGVARGGRGDRRADRRRPRRRGPARPAAAGAGGLRRDRVRAVRVGDGARRGAPGGRSAGRLARAPRPRGGRSDASDPLLPAVDDVAAARPAAHVRRRDRRRRRPRARDRLRAREARHHEGGGPGEELHRRRRLGPQHHDHPRQLPNARGRRLLQAGAQALRAPRAGARLQPAVLAAGPSHARPRRTRGERRARARRGEPAPRASTRA